MEKYVNIKENEIEITGAIGKDLFGNGYGFDQFKQDVKGIKGKIVVNINSLGGSLSEAYAIYDFIRSLDNKVITRVIGTSASAATILSMAGDRRYIAENARFLIHKPWVANISGNSDKMEKVLVELKELDKQLINLYVNRSKLSYDEVLDLMKQEIFISAEKAIEYGFIDDIIKDKNIIQDDMEKKLLNLFNTDNEEDVLVNVLNLIEENDRLKNVASQSDGDASQAQNSEKEEEEEASEKEEVEKESESQDEVEKESESQEEDKEDSENEEEKEDDEKDEEDDEKEKLLKRIAELEKALEEKEKEDAENRVIELTNYLKDKVAEGRITNEAYDGFFDVGADKGIDFLKNMVEKLPLPKTEKLVNYIDPELSSKSNKELYDMWKAGRISGESYLALKK